MKIKAVHLSELTHHKIESYKKLFLYDSEQKFIINVADNMIVKCGDYYIQQAIDNLILSAMWQEPQLRGNAYSQSLNNVIQNLIGCGGWI